MNFDNDDNNGDDDFVAPYITGTISIFFFFFT